MPSNNTPATSAAQIKVCPYCGGGQTVYSLWHPVTRCPMVKAIEYHPDGTISRVELVRWPHNPTLCNQMSDLTRVPTCKWEGAAETAPPVVNPW